MHHIAVDIDSCKSLPSPREAIMSTFALASLQNRSFLSSWAWVGTGIISVAWIFVVKGEKGEKVFGGVCEGKKMKTKIWIYAAMEGHFDSLICLEYSCLGRENAGDREAFASIWLDRDPLS